jgi:hypothetical protein
VLPQPLYAYLYAARNKEYLPTFISLIPQPTMLPTPSILANDTPSASKKSSIRPQTRNHRRGASRASSILGKCSSRCQTNSTTNRCLVQGQVHPISQSTVSDSLKPVYSYLDKDKKPQFPDRLARKDGKWPELEAALHQ